MNKAVVIGVLALALTGCAASGGGSGGGGDGAETPDADVIEGDSTTACIVDKAWSLDIGDAAAQLGEQLASNGMAVISSTGEGSQELWFDEAGLAGSATDLTYTIVVQMDEGMVMTMTQAHVGDPGGEWAWTDDDTIAFSDWESDRYTVTTVTSINGTATAPSVVNTDGLDGATMTVRCDGDTLTTQATGAPFVQRWVSTGSTTG